MDVTRRRNAEPDRAPHARASPLWVRYALFQVPSLLVVAALGWIAVRLWDLPPWLPLAAALAWAGKDAALYPILRDAYRTHPTPEPRRSLEGRTAVVVRVLDPDGTVQLGRELWQARLSAPGDPVPPGARVRIVDVDGLVLEVEPEKTDAGSSRVP